MFLAKFEIPDSFLSSHPLSKSPCILTNRLDSTCSILDLHNKYFYYFSH